MNTIVNLIVVWLTCNWEDERRRQVVHVRDDHGRRPKADERDQQDSVLGLVGFEVVERKDEQRTEEV